MKFTRKKPKFYKIVKILKVQLTKSDEKLNFGLRLKISDLKIRFFLLSRQMESARDHKFHSGYVHSSMVDHREGALYFAPASNSRVNRERAVHLSLLAFRKCVQK